MMKANMLIVLVVQFLLIFPLTLSIIQRQKIRPMRIQPYRRFAKLDKTAYLQITKNGQQRLMQAISNRVRKHVQQESTFQRLRLQYYNLQQTFYADARSRSAGIKDDIESVLPSCEPCKTDVLDIGKERTRCYASCMARQLDTYASYALQIADTIQNIFCTPLGFGFDTQFGKPRSFPSWYWSFSDFVTQFNEHNETFPMPSLVETWMSNLLWLDKSPMYLLSYIRSQIALDISSIQNDKNATVVDSDGSVLETPEKFAAKCGIQWDLREPVYSLINAAKQKSHYLDVILRGLFTVRSAAFYTPGRYHNLAGGIIEALGALIGTKCDVISYADGGNVTETTCDGLGSKPIPQFPIPLVFSKLVFPCDDSKLSTLRYS